MVQFTPLDLYQTDNLAWIRPYEPATLTPSTGQIRPRIGLLAVILIRVLVVVRLQRCQQVWHIIKVTYALSGVLPCAMPAPSGLHPSVHASKRLGGSLVLCPGLSGVLHLLIEFGLVIHKEKATSTTGAV